MSGNFRRNGSHPGKLLINNNLCYDLIKPKLNDTNGPTPQDLNRIESGYDLTDEELVNIEEKYDYPSQNCPLLMSWELDALNELGEAA